MQIDSMLYCYEQTLDGSSDASGEKTEQSPPKPKFSTC